MVTAHPQGKKILVVEDDYLLREALSLALAAEGYMVAFARDGQEATEKLHGKEPPDLIVLDLMLPGMDGGEFCRLRRGDPALAAVPVLLCSAVPDLGERAAALGAAGYLQKPFETGDLLKAIRALCPDRSPPVSAGGRPLPARPG